jgi:hypothetical protein
LSVSSISAKTGTAASTPILPAASAAASNCSIVTGEQRFQIVVPASFILGAHDLDQCGLGIGAEYLALVRCADATTDIAQRTNEAEIVLRSCIKFWGVLRLYWKRASQNKKAQDVRLSKSS